MAPDEIVPGPRVIPSHPLMVRVRFAPSPPLSPPPRPGQQREGHRYDATHSCGTFRVLNQKDLTLCHGLTLCHVLYLSAKWGHSLGNGGCCRFLGKLQRLYGRGLQLWRRDEGVVARSVQARNQEDHGASLFHTWEAGAPQTTVMELDVDSESSPLSVRSSEPNYSPDPGLDSPVSRCEPEAVATKRVGDEVCDLPCGMGWMGPCSPVAGTFVPRRLECSM